MFAKAFLASLTVAAVVGSAAIGVAAPVVAAKPDPDNASQTVFVGDLDLSGAAGARIALRRIEVAAGAICGEAPDARLLDRRGPYQACLSAVTDRAVAALGNANVTALRAPQGVSVLASRR
jgi:UrcA family protein